MSEEQRSDGDFVVYTWLNKAFGVPSTQMNPRTFYPWSSSMAYEYRAKLVVVLLNLASAFFLSERSCDRFGILFNCSMVFLLCDILYRNYPWKQPLKNHVWSLLCWWPTTQVLFYFVILIAFKFLKESCSLSGTSLYFLVGWTSFTTFWFVLSDTWKHKYDELEKQRPVTTSFSSYIEHCLLLILSSVVYPAFYSACLYAVWGVLIFKAIWIDLFINKAIQFLIFGFFIISCLKMVLLQMNTICQEAIEEWEYKEKLYSIKVINYLEELMDSLPPRSENFDSMAVAVPFLQQEVRILQNAKYIDKDMKEELQNLINEKKIKDFQEKLHDYAPYSTECCIS